MGHITWRLKYFSFQAAKLHLYEIRLFDRSGFLFQLNDP